MVKLYDEMLYDKECYMGYCYAVTSGKGGTGKSTVSVGLATAFAEKGKRTLLIDMDEGLRCLDILLGAENRLVFDLADVLGGKDIEDAVYATDTDNLFFIPAPSDIGKIEAADFNDFSNEIVKNYDIVIFDFPAGIDFSLYSSLPKHTVVLAVANPDPVSVRDAAAVCDKLPFDSIHTRLIINKFHYKPIFKGLYGDIDSIIDRSGIRLLGIVPESDELLYLSTKHKIKAKGRAMAAFMRITDRLLGIYQALPKPKKI